MIKGQVQSAEMNDWGFPRIKVAGTFYGGDKKASIPGGIVAGDTVEFEAYDKQKGDKSYPTFKYQSLRKLEGAAAATAVVPGAIVPSNARSATPSAAGRESYWSDKAAEDAKRDPRISYQGAYDRALTFADLAIRTKCFEALEKAAATKRLGILEAFVSEYADKIMQQTYAATVPAAKAVSVVADETADTIGDGESEAQWS